jgi:formate/nitrite transporter FocA (FNT family)
MSEAAGEDSPYLDEKEQRQAAERAPIGPMVIHEIVREEGLAELARPVAGLALSSFAAGLSIGFSFIVEAALQAGMPDTPWRHLVAALGYTVGFLIVILGRQQLFTETTLTALIPALTQRDARTFGETFRVWGVVLVCNLLGSALIGLALARTPLMPHETIAAMDALAQAALARPPLAMGIAAIGAGWLIGLTVWLLPGAGPARPWIIIILTYAIAVCAFPHVIAGSAEVAFYCFRGQGGLGTYFGHFLLPVLIGNTIGGTALVALLNHGPIAHEFNDTEKR